MSLERALSLDVGALADAIESVGFECTDCGDCCTSGDGPLAVTVFPDERRELADATETSPGEVTEPSPFGDDETFEWTVRRDACGDCFFHEGDACSVYESRPTVCRTYPFAVRFEDVGDDGFGADETVELDGNATLIVGDCEGTGSDITRDEALELAREVKRRAVKEEREARAVVEAYEPVDPPDDGVVVHDSEGAHVVERRDEDGDG
ncbi:MAG: YkgJ family cysteine cluster protein [Halobacteria archaeon]